MTQSTVAALNDLQSYIFESRTRLREDENVQKVCTEQEIDVFRDLLSEAEGWIIDLEIDAAAETYVSKERELKVVGILSL